jgi:hypothetical protein
MVDKPLSGMARRDMATARGKNFGPPMTLANMRQNGVRAVIARCEACARG